MLIEHSKDFLFAANLNEVARTQVKRMSLAAVHRLIASFAGCIFSRRAERGDPRVRFATPRTSVSVFTKIVAAGYTRCIVFSLLKRNSSMPK